MEKSAMAPEEDTVSNLPYDIIRIILLRLSVKDLLRFKSVSKSWNTMISDLWFVRMHLHESKHSDSHNLFLRKKSTEHGEDRFSLVRLEGLKFQIEAELNCPFRGERVLCTCDGMMLLTSSYRTYTLWNPSTRTKAMIWFPYKFDEYMTMKHGICHDTTIDDFKVVVASKKYYVVYSCKNKSWTKRKELSDSLVGRSTESGGVAVDGAIYWVSASANSYSRATKSYNSREIIYFDARDDNFRILERPKNVNDNDRYYLVCLRGCLCLYHRIRYDIQIWIKEKGRDNNSWKELMIVENVKTPISWFKPLCFVENKILIRLDATRFVVYSPCEKTFEEFEESKLSLEIKFVPCHNSLLCPIQNTRPKRKRSAYSQLS
ncbi:hypothetical protein DH2020_019697 [Rehmannia glutinosa]|uniref:F-box domain-containing protein n=1 Tax=Rehmannia glutinosa TaxID=99300 RepID=A0ABR0WE96_REHGL